MTRRDAILEGLPIPPEAFVVEIGAGTIPFSRTRLILDKHPFDDAERSGPIAGRIPVIQADAVRLPLKTQSCDVLFCSHVIEHLEDPARFVEEAQRCARKLYLEFPRARRELLYAWRYHRWLVEVEGSELRFFRNDVPQLFGGFFHEHYDMLLDAWSAERHTDLNAHWFGDPRELSVRISPASAFEHLVESSARGTGKREFASPYASEGAGPVEYPWSARLKVAAWSLMPTSLVRACRRRMGSGARPRDSLGDEILGRLLCQACRDESARIERAPGTDELGCSRCGARYRARDGVFDFDRPV
jgi:SAM-dependent methyltransferase